jgi:ABC-2 type transport system permease protein
MQANSNNTTSAPWPVRPDQGAAAAAAVTARQHWWQAFTGAWQADWRERRRDWRVALVLGLGVALAAVAALTSAVALLNTLQARAQSQQAEQQRWLNQGRKYPHSAAHYGVYVFKPLSALAALDPGVERFVGSSVWLEAHKQNDFIHRAAADQPGISRQFALSPALVLQVLAPLAIVFLGFGSFAREREQGLVGTLRLTGAPLSAVAAARGALLLLLSLALALPAVVAVLGVEAALVGSSPFVDGIWRAALMALGTLIYLAAWTALVLAASAASATLRTSLALLLALWAATALVLPRLASEWSEAAAPLPSMQAFRAGLDKELGEPHDPVEEARFKAALLKEYGVTDEKQLPVNWSGINLQRGEEHGDRVFDKHFGGLFAAMQRQSAATAWAGWLSPTLALAGLSGAAAASDHAHHVQFVNRAEQQRRAIQKVMNNAIAATPNGSRIDGDQSLWQRVPTFDFKFAPLAAGTAAHHLLPLLGALLVGLTLCALALRGLRRGALR